MITKIENLRNQFLRSVMKRQSLKLLLSVFTLSACAVYQPNPLTKTIRLMSTLRERRAKRLR